MSKNEKRYFKVRVNAGNSTKEAEKARIYLKLYDTINQMDTFDGEKLKKKFPLNLSAHKKQLYDSILRSMRDYQSKNSKQIQIKELIMDSKYLYERSLYDLSSKRLEEAKKLALQIDDQLALLDINKQERHLLRERMAGKQKASEKIEDALQEKKTIIENINLEHYYNDIYDRLFSIVRKKFQLKKEEERAALKTQFEPSLFANENIPNAAFARRRFHQCAAIYHQLLGESQKVNEHFSAVVEWWKSNPSFQKEAYYWYIIDLSNLLQHCLRKRDFTLFESIVSDIEDHLVAGTAQGYNEHTQGIAFHKLYLNKLSYFIIRDQLEAAQRMVPKLETGLSRYKINIGSQLILFYNIVVLFLILKEHEQFNYWNSKIIHLIPSSYREGIQRIALIFNLIYSLENEEYLPDSLALKLINQHFKTTFQLKKESFELNCVAHFRALSNLAPSDRKENYQQFYDFLKKVSTSGGKITGLDILTFWVESKIKRVSLREIIRKALNT